MELFTRNEHNESVDHIPSNTNLGGEWWSQPRAATIAPNVSTAMPASSSFDYFSFTSAAHSISNSHSSSIRDCTTPGSSSGSRSGADSPIGGLPTSPAAMFLSGFVDVSASRSSSMPSHKLDDDETPGPRPQRPRVRTDVDTDRPDVVGGYQLGQVIGHGAFSTIRRATSVPTDRISPVTVVAVKIVRRNDSRPGASEARVRLSHEAKIWNQLSHEHVLPLFSSLEAPEATYLFTLYCPAGSLLDVINSHKSDGLEGVGMDDAGMLFRQIVRGLKYLHEVVRLVHGDIKLENVLVDDQGSCRIADFGLSRWMGDAPPDMGGGEAEAVVPPHGLPVHLSLHRPRGRPGRITNSPFARGQPKAHTASESYHTNTNAANMPTHPQHWFPPGSLPYASPELLAPHPAPLPPNPAQDIWALGCVLYALLFGKLPFSDPFEPRLQMKIVRGIWKLPSNCRRSVGGFTAGNKSRMGQGSISRSRSRNRAYGQPRRTGGGGGRDRSSSARRPQMQKSPHSPTFLYNAPSAARMRSKSRGRRQRSISPTPANSKAIGRVAENVLHGCLCVGINDRWTVSMIDEVGWGVGWDLDVDEAGEEYDEEMEESSASEEMSASASGSSGAPSLIGGVGGVLSGVGDRDRFGNRYYIAPGDPQAPQGGRRPSELYSTTLGMVTSPTTDTNRHTIPQHPKTLQTVTEAYLSSEPGKIVIASGSNDELKSVSADDLLLRARPITTDAIDAVKDSKERRGWMDNIPIRARGKRGKTSRSSSRPSTAAQTPETFTPPPLPAIEADPFHAFRQGHIPSAFSRSSSRNLSRAASAVPSRAASKERGVGEQQRGGTEVQPILGMGLSGADWSRGRPRDNVNVAAWRGPSTTSFLSAIGVNLAQSSSYPLPAEMTTSVERSVDSWRLPPFNKRNKESSMSPSPSPSPSTPMDGSLVRVKGGNPSAAAPAMRSRSPNRERVRRGDEAYSLGSTSPVASHSRSKVDDGSAIAEEPTTETDENVGDEEMTVPLPAPAARGWPAWPW
ncbi:hypothetical protein FRB94_012360 [Tulasnella sp. JGI-2019a]|nr:hypothetical protein FRB94_012360 [Tulasnella sp. JGI-2019a]